MEILSLRFCWLQNTYSKLKIDFCKTEEKRAFLRLYRKRAFLFHWNMHLVSVVKVNPHFAGLFLNIPETGSWKRNCWLISLLEESYLSMTIVWGDMCTLLIQFCFKDWCNDMRTLPFGPRNCPQHVCAKDHECVRPVQVSVNFLNTLLVLHC